MKKILVYGLSNKIAAIVMTLSVLETHFPISSLSKCDILYWWRVEPQI